MITTYAIKTLFRSAVARLRGPLSIEAIEAYYHKIPNSIQVSWERDGDMIVGTVKAGNHEFYTQGKDADDFIEMVNDAVYTVYEIPFEYLDVIERLKPFSPSLEQRKALYGKDKDIISISKKNSLKLA